MADAQGCVPESGSGQAAPLEDPGFQATAGASRRRYLLYGFFFKIRGLMAGILLVAMFFGRPGEGTRPAFNWAMGLPLFAAALLLRIRSQQYLRYRLREHSDLALSGPYARVRNPVYIANIAGLGALCILCGVNWMAPIAVGWSALVYHLSVRFEEMRLASCFGEAYRYYLESVPRWLPRLRAARQPNSGRAGFWRAAGVEWQNLLLLLLPLGKQWSLRPQGGRVHALVDRVIGAALAHQGALVLLLVLGMAGLAALNLGRLRSARGRKAQRAMGQPARVEDVSP